MAIIRVTVLTVTIYQLRTRVSEIYCVEKLWQCLSQEKTTPRPDKDSSIDPGRLTISFSSSLAMNFTDDAVFLGWFPTIHTFCLMSCPLYSLVTKTMVSRPDLSYLQEDFAMVAFIFTKLATVYKKISLGQPIITRVRFITSASKFSLSVVEFVHCFSVLSICDLSQHSILFGANKRDIFVDNKPFRVRWLPRNKMRRKITNPEPLSGGKGLLSSLRRANVYGR